MKIAPWLFGILFASSAALVGAQETPPDSEAAWQQHWQKVQEYRQAWQAAKTPEERRRLREQHWQSMHAGPGMAGGCPMMGPGMMHGEGMDRPGGGMGTTGGGQGMPGGHGAMMGEPTPEQLDRHIAHLEKMLEELRAHREMLDTQ
ncbi:hypothetical protein [Azotobacter salinestris]|uniref:hypothetical protein n=1 Tax=Azotobacter salinestris TaxID=69964 RepID=UPI001266CCF9|nr:hypothetical protein [Azotobacter salinestris]